MTLEFVTNYKLVIGICKSLDGVYPLTVGKHGALEHNSTVCRHNITNENFRLRTISEEENYL